MILTVTEINRELGTYKIEFLDTPHSPGVSYHYELRERTNPEDEFSTSGTFYTNPDGSYTMNRQYQARTTVIEMYVRNPSTQAVSNTEVFDISSSYREPDPDTPPSTSKPALILAGFPLAIRCLWLLRETVVPGYVHRLLHPLI